MYIHIIFVAAFIAEIQHNVFTMQNVVSSFNFEHFLSFHPPNPYLDLILNYDYQIFSMYCLRDSIYMLGFGQCYITV